MNDTQAMLELGERTFVSIDQGGVVRVRVKEARV